MPLETKDQFETLLVKTDDFTSKIDPLINYFNASPPFLNVIVAPRGSGKSTMLHYIANSLREKNILVCFVTYQPSILKGQQDPAYGIGNDLISKITADLAEATWAFVAGDAKRLYKLRTLCRELELTNSQEGLDTKSLSTFSYSTNQRKLSALLKYLKENKIPAFLAIDNYDKLDPDRAMAFLKCNLAQPLFEELESAGVSIALVTRLELRDEIGVGDLNYLGKPISLNGLNPTEAYSLIKKRLSWKSIEQKDFFDQDSITRITIKEDGIPRNILETVRMCMVKAAENGYDFLTEEIVLEILRRNEHTAAEYYQTIKKDSAALSGLLSLAAVSKDTDADAFRTILQALVDIWEDRKVSLDAENLLRKNKLLFLSEKTQDFTRKKGFISSDVKALLRTIAERFPLNTFMDWLAAGEPVFAFVPSSEDQRTNSVIDEQFQIIIPLFKRDEVKHAVRDAYTSYKTWTEEIARGEYDDVIQLLSDMWGSLWGAALAAYYSDKIRAEKRIDISLPNYNTVESFLIAHEETRSHVADFATVWQYYALAEKQVPIEQTLIEGLYPRVMNTVSALLEMSMQILPYLKELGIPLPKFRVRDSQELDQKLAPYIRSESRYIYESLEGVSPSDFLALSWIERNFIFSYVYGAKTFFTDLNLDLYQCQPSTLTPKFIPEYVKKQITFQELPEGHLIGYYNSFEFCDSIIKMAHSKPTLIKIFSRKNTVDIGISVDEPFLLGSVDYSTSKFDTKIDLTTNPFSEIKTLKRPPTVFVSYSSKDKEFAKQLVSDLRTSGIKVWVDMWEIAVGDSIIEKIAKAIQENDYIAVVLSQHSCKSPWVTKELALALTKELDQKRVVVLPLLAKKCEIPPMLKDKHYINFIKNYRSGLTELVSKLLQVKT